ncbi:MAG: twin-arginine translocase subunit TatC [Alphaproteobacteria bacterium]|nr:twin-arginine translocase subunit TatC [Alphaproteobacteria bacterium]
MDDDEPPKPPDAAAPADPPGKAHRDAELRRLREEREAERLQAQLDELEASRMPLMDHLVELRNRVMYATGALILGSLVGLAYAQQFFDVLRMPFVDACQDAGLVCKIVLMKNPFEGVFTYFKLALLSGALLASPVVFYQVWAFVAPGLYKTERRVVFPLAVSSATLFLMGAAFCFYVMLPFAFPFFIQVLGPEIESTISADGYLSSLVSMLLAFGASFQLPVVIFFMASAGLVDHRDLLKGFRYAVVAIFAFAAVITPPDPLTQALLAMPLILLYGVGIGVAWLVSTKKRPPAP